MRKCALLPVVLSILIVFILFVPVVRLPGYAWTSVCGPHGCVSDIVQYESISYAYGGFGAVFQTGVNWYNVNGWMCMCPAETATSHVPCCVPPYADVIWPALVIMLAVDIGSIFVMLFYIRYSTFEKRQSAAAQS